MGLENVTPMGQLCHLSQKNVTVFGPDGAYSPTTKQVSKKRSSGVNVTGLYRRGQVLWWNCQNDGHRVRLSLETTDHTAAVRKVLEYRAKPQMLTAGRWEFEVDQLPYRSGEAWPAFPFLLEEPTIRSGEVRMGKRGFSAFGYFVLDTHDEAVT